MTNNEGWGYPENARKAHFFIKGRSLCRKWLYLGYVVGRDEIGDPDNCKTCERMLIARRKEEEAA